MTVLILAIGSRGDVQPYVALGQGLRRAGHRVVLATSPRFRTMVEDHGIGWAFLSDDLVALVESPDGRGAFEDMGGIVTGVRAARRLFRQAEAIQHDLVRDGWSAARDVRPDVIVFHPKMLAGAHYAEALGVPAVLAAVFPQLVPTATMPGVGFPDWPLGPLYRRLTNGVVLGIAGALGRRYYGPWREAQGLPKRSAGLLTAPDGSPLPVLFGHSRHVVPDPPDWPPGVAATGFWFLDDDAPWTPPPALEAFLAAGEAPVYVGFGSMAGRDPARTTRLVVEALARAGVRGILASGWGGLAAGDLPPDVFALDEAPHAWLFPRVAAVVHHGGAGTTAAGLRAGRPTVICPFFGDQPFWGRRVEALGVGSAPVPQKRLTAERLAAAIREVTTSDAIRRRAAALGEAIRQEDGTGEAVRRIEAIHAGGRRGGAR